MLSSRSTAPPSLQKLRPRYHALIPIPGLFSALIQALLRTSPPTLMRVPIPGASRLPLASNAIALGASPGLRVILHCSYLLMRPRAGRGLPRQLDPDRWRLRLRMPVKTSPSTHSPSRQKKNRRHSRPQTPPKLARHRSQRKSRPWSRPPKSSRSRVPPQFRFFVPANWPIPSSIMIVRASSKPRRFCRHLPP